MKKDILSMHFREVFRAEKARRYVWNGQTYLGIAE